MRFRGFVMLFCAVFIPAFLCGFAVLLCYFVRCLNRHFCAVLRFCYVILCGVYIPVFLSGFAVLVPSLRPPLFRLLSDLKFYYMDVKVSCKGTDTEADLSVLIHATFISST